MNKERLFDIPTAQMDLCCEGDLNALNIVDENSNQNREIEMGHTYLGQMIAHDITPSTNLHSGRKNISPALNLDSLYGDEQNKAYLENGQFLFGDAVFTNGGVSKNLDLYRKNTYSAEALIPEPRNDENIIISQMHFLWQKFHNKIYARVNEFQNIKDKLNATRLIVTKFFHQVVINDYLFQLLQPDIYNLYFKKDFSFYYKGCSNLLKKGLPVEFSHAVFRFGHSMVRKEYTLNERLTIQTVDMLSNRKPRLPVDSIINWGSFFTLDNIYDSIIFKRFKSGEDKGNESTQDGSTTLLFANSIDTNFVGAMKNIPFINGNPKDIRHINLDAGKSEKSPNGSHIRNILLELENDELTRILNSKYYKNHEKDISKLSLWPYVLKEAEINNKEFHNNGLGPVGSLIVAEVLNASMNLLNFNKVDEEIKSAYLNILNDIKNKQIGHDTEGKGYKEGEKLKIKNCIEQDSIKMGYIINYIYKGGTI